MIKKTIALLVRMENGKEYLLEQKDISQIVEFAKNFSAEIYRVKTDPKFILPLSILPQTMCEENYVLPKTYKKIERIIPSHKVKTIEHIVKMSQIENSTPLEQRIKIKAIKLNIKNRLLSGEKVSLNNLCEQYSEFSRQNISQYFYSTRTELTKQGYNFKKIRVGEYEIRYTLNTQTIYQSNTTNMYQQLKNNDWIVWTV